MVASLPSFLSAQDFAPFKSKIQGTSGAWGNDGSIGEGVSTRRKKYAIRVMDHCSGEEREESPTGIYEAGQTREKGNETAGEDANSMAKRGIAAKGTESRPESPVIIKSEVEIDSGPTIASSSHPIESHMANNGGNGMQESYDSHKATVERLRLGCEYEESATQRTYEYVLKMYMNDLINY